MQNFVRIVPPPARDLEGRAPKKNILSFFKKIYTSATPEKQGTFFFGVAERSDAVAERFIQHQDFDGKKFGFCSGDTANEISGYFLSLNFVPAVRWRREKVASYFFTLKEYLRFLSHFALRNLLKIAMTCTDSVRIESLPGSKFEIGYRVRDAYLAKSPKAIYLKREENIRHSSHTHRFTPFR